MVTNIVDSIRLEDLRKGDSFQYNYQQWSITDYATYKDRNGYKTEEWLIESVDSNLSIKSKRYLIREVDPQNSNNRINWYIAQEIKQPEIFALDQEANNGNIVPTLLPKMLRQDTPFPQLSYLGITYDLESQTKGTYKAKMWRDTRVSWDYWDSAHQVNLAFEAWRDSELHIYLSQIVNPNSFSNLEKKYSSKSIIGKLNYSLKLEAIFAVLLILWGIWLLIF